MSIKWFVLLFSFSLCALEDVSLSDKKGLDNYKFILLMPKDDANYFCAVFTLDSLRVCRFPNGPMWSNSLNNHKLHTISNRDCLEIKNHANILPVLCIDEGKLQGHSVSRCNKNVCGFALPWEAGMAYVFDDLKDVGKVAGFIIENKYLNKIQLPSVRSIEIIDFEDEDDLDEIDLMIADNEDEEMDGKVLPYPLEDIKNALGKIFIYGLIQYHNAKDKLVALMSKKSGKRKA